MNSQPEGRAMLDAETVVFHSGETGSRVRVHIQEERCEIVLVFADLSGEGDVLALEINPRRSNESLTTPPGGEVQRVADGIDPTVVRRVGRNFETYVDYARSVIRWDRERTRDALTALRSAGRTKRGLSIDYLSQIATEYRALIDAEDPHPIKTLGQRHHAEISTASRWVKRCRELGLIPDTQPAA